MALETVALVATIIATPLSVGLNAVMWRKIGNLEEAVKKSCPWGADNCPSFKRAKEEAAPARGMSGEIGEKSITWKGKEGS
jgi:hypothetical protein